MTRTMSESEESDLLRSPEAPTVRPNEDDSTTANHPYIDELLEVENLAISTDPLDPPPPNT